MKLYLQVIKNKIIAIDSEINQQCNIECEVSSIDEFYQFAKKYDELDEEIEEQIRELLENSDEKKSIKAYKIKHWVSNRSFGELIDMYTNGEIRRPDMQREFIWDAQKSSRLIESIILGLPIPPLFLLEVGDNEYELIDGYQRITTVTNYINEEPWNGKVEGKRKTKSRLSGNISDELKGKSFSDLDQEYQRMIKRSTIPLIEFKQITPENLSSKYLIFERINTGSEKLNQMQIRKALAYGKFIDSVYKQANECNQLKQLFSISAIKKDNHVEAFLRIYVMTKVAYKEYKCDKDGLNNILNEFCESNRNDEVSCEYMDKFNKALEFMGKVFIDKNNMFKRVEIDNNGNESFEGNMNVSIMEAMLGVAIKNDSIYSEQIANDIRARYINEMNEIIQKSIKKQDENPFSISTGSKIAIEKRFKICEKILGRDL